VAGPLPGSDGPSLVIGIGASAGGVEALRAVVAQLPSGFDGAVCVVLHVAPTGKSLLAPILDRATPLETAVALDGERLAAGRVYVAPPDRHLLVEDGRISLSRGPKENGSRPAVDPMLRSLASSYGSRAIAVILSGALGDGSAGSAAVAAAGGAVLVQDPSEAAVPSMPESALRAVGGRASVLPLNELGGALVELADARRSMGEDVAVLPDSPRDEASPTPAGPPTSLSCPECSGPLWDVGHSAAPGYRCRVGHAYSEDALVAAQATSVEAALWTAVEVLEERAELLRRVASRRAVAPRTNRRLEEGAADALRRARLIRGALGSAPEGADAFRLQAAGGAE
jgi:two-component system, chemotaxis family, protein-glutamate methylesterase/glutaminase